MILQPAALREKLASVPVIKSALSLMTGTMVTSALGLLFWILAANLYDPADFGVSTTAIYTMIMLADVSCLGLRTGLVRYIPKAGSATGRTIVWGYALVLAASSLTAGVFLVGLNIWAPDLTELRNSVLLFIFFVASTAFWALFMLQDAVLVGLRRAPWVPIENTLFGVLKIALLVPFAAWSPTLGIFWAWTLPVFPIVVGINVLMAGVARNRADDVLDGATVRPARVAAAGQTVRARLAASFRQTKALLRDIITFSLADWLSALARLVALGAIPLMVLAQTDKDQAGYFQAAWLIAFTIMSLSANAAYALLAESSYDQAKLHRNSLQAAMLSLGLTVPVMIVGLIGAPYLLWIYGSDYADNSSTVLRILLVAAVPNVLHQLYIGRLRVQGRLGGVIFFETLLAVIAVGLSWLFIPRYGIDGVGIAWLVGLTLLGGYALIAESTWWWASRLDTGVVRRIGSGVRRARSGRPARGMSERLDEVLSVAAPNATEVIWLPADEHGQTALVDTEPGRQLEVAFARSAEGVERLTRERSVIDTIRADSALAGLLPMLPEPVGLGQRLRLEFSAYRRTSGTSVAELVNNERIGVGEACWSILRAMEPLRAAARPVTVTEATLATWIDGPIANLMSEGRASNSQVGRLRHRLEEGFVGATVSIGRIHGDLVMANAAAAPSAHGPEIVGFRRWERSREMPSVIDAAVLALTAMTDERSAEPGGAVELGDVVVELLADSRSFDEHPALVGAGPQPGVPSTAVILLAWLYLVGRPNPVDGPVVSDVFWLARNAQPVLAQLNNGAGAMV